jgi:hypothetical protein
MAQVFYPITNTLSRVTVFGAVFIIAAIAWAAGLWTRSPYVTLAGVARDQPVPFSHDHHVTGLGIDCRYCHATVETSAFAGMPTTETCMGCHTYVWKESPILAPVRESWRTGQPLHWTRVHDVADFVYFDHSIHVAKGVSCEECHGPVDRMPLMYKAFAMHMEWCLECHRRPRNGTSQTAGTAQPYSTSDHAAERPTDRPTKTALAARDTTERLSHTSQLTNCVICHR